MGVDQAITPASKDKEELQLSGKRRSEAARARRPHPGEMRRKHSNKDAGEGILVGKAGMPLPLVFSQQAQEVLDDVEAVIAPWVVPDYSPPPNAMPKAKAYAAQVATLGDPSPKRFDETLRIEEVEGRDSLG